MTEKKVDELIDALHLYIQSVVDMDRGWSNGYFTPDERYRANTTRLKEALSEFSNALPGYAKEGCFTNVGEGYKPETDTVKLMWQKVDEARLEKAQSEIERLKKEAGMLTEEAEEYYINMNKAHKENYRLREALQEIADKGGAWSKEIARRALRNISDDRI